MSILARKTEPQPSRFTLIINGARDHINGYDDGEWPASDRPAGYYDSSPVEPLDLQETNIF